MPASTAIFVFFPVILLLSIAIPTLLLSFLQLFLCRKELKWGRILPIFSLTVSVLAFLLMLSFGPWVFGGPGLYRVLSLALILLVLLNIPTLIYYLIYRSEKRKRIQENVNRTRIDDLE